VFTVSFWKATAERVVTAFAVSLISVLFVGAEVLDVTQIRWGQALGIAGGAALLSLLKGLVAGTGVIGPKGSPSLVRDPAAANPTAAATLTGPNQPTTYTNGGTGSNVRMVDQQRENMRQAEPEFGPKQGGYRGGDVTPPD
jgi:hypothetical protein